ncbi:MAG: EamA family transporter [Nanoarchaeota archaeon]|nr:EamA family transporter [Nanoarchaeota archaeon]
MTTSIFSIIATLGACVMGAYASVLMKKASASFTFNLRKLMRNSHLIIAVALYGISTLIFIPALKYGELSVLYPLVATTYIWVSFFSMWFLKERMNTWKWAGIAIIIIGVAFIGFSS